MNIFFYLEIAPEEALGFCLGEYNVKPLSILLCIEAQNLSQPPPEEKTNKSTRNPAKVTHSPSSFDFNSVEIYQYFNIMF